MSSLKGSLRGYLASLPSGYCSSKNPDSLLGEASASLVGGLGMHCEVRIEDFAVGSLPLWLVIEGLNMDCHDRVDFA